MMKPAEIRILRRWARVSASRAGNSRNSSVFGLRPSDFGVVALAAALLLPGVTCFGGFVSETPAEFLTSGDFNGDGLADVLVLDKLTGNARVGYQDAAGVLTWSAPLVTGVENATGCAVGPLLQTTRDAVAVTAPDANRVNLVDLSATNAAGTPVLVTPGGLGPHTLVALANPLGGFPPAYNDLLAASSDNDASAERLDLLALSAGAATPAGHFAESGPFDRGNALALSAAAPTFAAGLVRGATDTLDLWQFTNAPAVMLAWSNLPPGSDYTFGRFNAEPLPRFLFYQPGGSNVTVVPLLQTVSGYAFGAAVSVSFTEAVQQVVYVALSAADGSAMIQFADGVQGMSLPGGLPSLAPAYRSGAGAAGNVFTGVVALGGGNFALLDAPPGSASSVHAQVVHFDGTSYTQRSSSNLPSLSSRATRANLWLFQSEPFVNRAPGFIASLNAPDWSDMVGGLPGAVTVSQESDGGTTSGLGNAVTNNLGPPPTGVAYGLPNQYRDVISVFSYAGPRPPEPVTVTISPPAGIYDGPIQISFSTLNASDKVFYRVGAPDAWHQYVAAFPLTNDATIQFYGRNAANARSRLQTAGYSLGHDGQPTPTLNLGNGNSTTNPPPPFVGNTNAIPLSSVGTVFYSRLSSGTNGSIWAINLDGSGDTYLTAGEHPRASRDGRYLAFLRGGSPLVTQGDLWVRDLQTGQETMLGTNSNFIAGYDWDRTGTNLVFDFSCWLWRIGLSGPPALLPLTTDCYDDAPVVNPVDGRLAFHNLNPNAGISGLYVTTPDLTAKTNLNLAVAYPSWPEWSPDGQWLALVEGNGPNTAFSPDAGTNLYVVRADGARLSQITRFNDGTNRFPHGALWSPDGTALVGAGTIFGTNGLWIIPLTADLSDCLGPPILLPTSPGDPIDFAGSIVVAPPAPNPAGLFIRLETSAVVVYWSTNFPDYHLEYTRNLAPPVTWQPVTAFIPINGLNYEFSQPLTSLSARKFFRLHKP